MPWLLLIAALSGGPGFHKRGPPRVMKLRSRRDQQNHVTVQRSDHNPSMVVQKSILGESAVHKHLCKSMEHMYTTVCDGGEGKGQRILCLDGGGIKVSRISQCRAAGIRK